MTDKTPLTETYWRTADQARHFIIPDAEPRRPGPLALLSLMGGGLDADPAWAARFEVSETQARAWAQEEFGFLLAQLRERIDAKLARTRRVIDRARHMPAGPGSTVTPDALPAVLALMGTLPGAIADSLSGDPARVTKADTALSDIQSRLNTSGIDVGTKLGQFPARLAGLRQEFEAARKPDKDGQR